jgi:predicted DNA-binding transcriptional regulator YafY
MGWKTERLLAIMLLLQDRGPITARELSRILEVSERTIYRDIQSLSIAGVPAANPQDLAEGMPFQKTTQ